MEQVRLRPVADDELPALLEQGREDYATSLERDAGRPAAEAHAKAARDYESLFPAGRPSEGQQVFVLEETESGSAIGRLHYAERPPGSGRVWLYEISIDEAWRGRGLGRAAMLAFERNIAEQGFKTAALNVFGGNEVARALYRSLGYREVAVEMTKDTLDG